MKARVLVVLLAALPLSLQAQTGGAPPAQPAPAQPPPAQPPQTNPAAPRQTASQTRPSMEIRVTDHSGNGIPDVEVTVTGPMQRSGKTEANGALAFKAVVPGTYRLRFNRKDYVTLEREVNVRGSGPVHVDAALSAAPVVEAPPAPPTPEPAPSMPDVSVEPKTVFIPDFIDQNYLGRAPRKDSVLGCAPSSTTTLLQLREPLGEHVHADTDELLYVVAGEATLKVGGRDNRIEAGSYSLDPRRVPHSITRRGSNPIVLLSIEAGKPCAGLAAAKGVAPTKEPR